MCNNHDSKVAPNTCVNEAKHAKLVHLAGTLWFVLCLGFIVITALRQAGFDWWIIFSLSGHSAMVILLLVSVYLFALFRGVHKSASCQLEHPLTSTSYYIVFYVGSPLLGGLAGLLGSLGMQHGLMDYVQGASLGTLVTTFLVWVLLDPALAILETTLPEPKEHRRKRLAQQRAMREERQRRREQLLSQIAQKQEEDRQRWQASLEPSSLELARLLTTDEGGYSRAEKQAVDLGVDAWRLGGISCMRRLHEMAIESYTQEHKQSPADYITYWWDGIGGWRNPSP